MINNYSNTTKPKIILTLTKDKYNLVHTNEKNKQYIIYK